VLEESGKTTYQSYNEFLDNLLQVPIARRQDFKEQLDKFKIITILVESGEWEVYEEVKDIKEHSFEEMIKLNKPEQLERDEDKPKTKTESMLEKGHNFIDNLRKDWSLYGNDKKR
jgi:hypothetical protein